MTSSQIDFRSSSDRRAAEDQLTESGDWIFTDDGDLIPMDDSVRCEDGVTVHVDDDFFTCENCGMHYSDDSDRAPLEDGDNRFYCCGDCADDDGLYCWDDGVWRSEPETESGGLLPYYASNPTIQPASELEPYRIGFEVEKEDESVLSDLYPLSDYASRYGWIAVGDGSLEDGGFELVSPCWNLANIKTIKENIGRIGAIDADASVRCGGHITVSRYGESGQQLAERCSDFFCLLMALYPLRLKSSWSKPMKKDRLRDNGDKYRAFNVKSDRVEIRLLSRVKDRLQLCWRAELINWGIRQEGSAVQDAIGDCSSFLHYHLSKRYAADRLRERLALFGDFKTWHDSRSDLPYDEQDAAMPATIKPYVYGG